MSIDRVNISNRGIDQAQATQAMESVRNAAKAKQASGTTNDSLAISSKAKDIERLGNQIEESRTERFNQVRDALAAGTYHVSGRAIAQKLIDSNTK
jgi:flagellar biosynthesis anti-sigma factor FlgM